jgi:quinone-modifying oxidoreductase subunit QmoC
MILNRLKQTTSTYFDWVFILILLFIAITGFMTEILHYARVDELRYPVYFAHLVLVLTLFIYLPYSKFSHFLYRTIALVYAEHYGRKKER